MESKGQLVAHRGAVLAERKELAAIPTPIGTWSWKPIPHYDLAETLIGKLNEAGMTVTREQYAVTPSGNQMFGVLDVGGSDDPSYGRSVGFRNSHDKSLKVQIVAGGRVFVCDNLALSGDSILLAHKHTRGLNLSYAVRVGVEKYFEATMKFEASIKVAQGAELSEGAAKQAFFDLFYKGIVPASVFDSATKNYFKAEDLNYEDCKPRTVWGFHNSVTRALRDLTPNSAMKATMALSRFVGLQ